MNDYSRDETEFGAFEDPAACASVGGIFDKIAKPFIGKPKKKIEANVHAQIAAQGASAAQLAMLRQAQQNLHIHAADVAKGVATSAKIGLAVASFVVPGGAVAGTAALGGLVAADKLVAAGQRGVAAAKTTIDTTKHLAAAGHIDAQRGLQAIGLASAERAAKGIPAGVEQKVTAAGHAAYTSFLSARKPVVVKPVAPAPKPAAPPKLPAIHAPVAPPRPVVAMPVRAPIAPVYVPPRAGNTRAPVLPAPAPVARDWLVTDDGKVQRIVRGHAIHVSGRGWYVGQFGLQRIGA